MIYPSETILTDDYPVYYGFCYLVDEKVIVSQVTGTVKDLKNEIGAQEIRRCDMGERKMFT